jgi:hypothetical protein
MDHLVDIVFKKSVNEHALCEMYADMCSVLCKRLSGLPPQNGEDRTYTFTRALLSRIQEEFDNLPHYLEPSAEQIDTLSVDELHVIVREKTDHTIGYMKFIGQLYQRNLEGYHGYAIFAGHRPAVDCPEISWERVVCCLEMLLGKR